MLLTVDPEKPKKEDYSFLDSNQKRLIPTIRDFYLFNRFLNFCVIKDPTTFKRDFISLMVRYEKISSSTAEASFDRLEAVGTFKHFKYLSEVNKSTGLIAFCSSVLTHILPKNPSFIRFLQHCEFDTHCHPHIWISQPNDDFNKFEEFIKELKPGQRSFITTMVLGSKGQLKPSVLEIDPSKNPGLKQTGKKPGDVGKRVHRKVIVPTYEFWHKNLKTKPFQGGDKPKVYRIAEEPFIGSYVIEDDKIVELEVPVGLSKQQLKRLLGYITVDINVLIEKFDTEQDLDPGR